MPLVGLLVVRNPEIKLNGTVALSLFGPSALLARFFLSFALVMRFDGDQPFEFVLRYRGERLHRVDRCLPNAIDVQTIVSVAIGVASVDHCAPIHVGVSRLQIGRQAPACFGDHLESADNSQTSHRFGREPFAINTNNELPNVTGVLRDVRQRLAAVRRSEGRDCLSEDALAQIAVQVLPVSKISTSAHDVCKKQAQRRVLVKVQVAVCIEIDENIDIASLCCVAMYDGAKKRGVKNPSRSKLSFRAAQYCKVTVEIRRHDLYILAE